MMGGGEAAEPSVLRVALADDEPLARSRLRALLAAEPHVELVSEAASGAEAVRGVLQSSPDVLLLDVEMPAGDGFEVLRALPPESLPVVVFVTAWQQHAVRAFEAQALDFLLKPYDKERFRAALARARQQVRLVRRGEAVARQEALLSGLALSEAPLRRLPVKVDGRIRFVDCSAISHVESEANYVRVHVGTEQHVLRETLTHLEERLDTRRFLRVHRSVLVNLDQVREAEPLSQGEYLLVLGSSGTAVRTGRSHRVRVEAALGLGSDSAR
ncbi:two component transcriptional regulator, LytTR family [Myxococcus fulvus]|uniref:DNA-binding response regulator n=1 Tax=Myxococcus fulvus TaxID=33 RepID=A0A511TAK6_MYXFU|nr:LytTR family DNA-binding domain-containing protein [Myxococcus fulvus]GEN10198.1 DNA-binding response regulator [Myxococcus fulvus]SEU35132.1 two component transcriptional regulator, LytTR family [Myxococcus fulvus]